MNYRTSKRARGLARVITAAALICIGGTAVASATSDTAAPRPHTRIVSNSLFLHPGWGWR